MCHDPGAGTACLSRRDVPPSARRRAVAARRLPKPAPAPFNAPVRLLLLLLPLLLALPARADGVAAVATYGVSTGRRTLKGLPIKRVITDKAAWDRAMERFDEAPPTPDFAKQVALLVVADSTGGTKTWLDGLELQGDLLRCVLHREEPLRLEPSAQPTITAHIAVLAPFAGGVHLDHRTHLPGGGGSISRPAEPAPEDRDQALVPQLGPDLRLSFARADGQPLPAGLAVLLRTEATFPSRKDLPSRVATDPFPHLGLGFPRVRDDVRYLLAAHAPGWRSSNALVITRLPKDGPDGSPPPIVHRFLLEPVQGAR
jgi:hypothetical protein